MGFSVSSKIKLNTGVINQLDSNAKRALRDTTDALLTKIKNSQVMPFDTGNLQNESTFADYSQLEQGVTSIISSTPYARRLYFHPEYNFSREENIAAGGLWLIPWLEGGTRQNFCSRTFAKIYKGLTGV